LTPFKTAAERAGISTQKHFKIFRNLTSEMRDFFIYLFFNDGEYFNHIHSL
jgi:hypothetical protein